jgi:predicted dienelactone hydrolase
MKKNAITRRVPAWRRDAQDSQATSIPRRTVLLSGIALPLGVLAARAAAETTTETTAATTAAETAATVANARWSAPSTQLTLPPPTGRHRIGTVSLHLVDPSRPDPWVPGVPFRELMIQIWYPARAADGYPRAPYTTPATARAFEKIFDLPVLDWPITRASLGAPVRPCGGGWPVVLYSPSLGGERFETTCLVEELASRGYVVVTIDHVRDSGAVELPDGRLETAAVPEPTSDTDNPVTTKEIESRVADVAFVLDQLTAINRGHNPDHEHRPLPDGLRGELGLDRVGLLGHSDGGSTIAHALHTDARFAVGVNLDGTLWTPQAVAGSDRPLLLFGRQDLDPFEAATWAQFQANQRGPELQINLLGSTHDTFKDFAALVPQVAPIIGQPPSWVVQDIGTIDGLRAVAVIRTYVTAYFDRYLRHRGSDLLDGPSPRYPEVVFREESST